MTLDDKDMILQALRMWKNYIETGNVVLSKDDCIIDKDLQRKIKNLNNDQKNFIEKIDMLSFDILTDRKKIINNSN